MLRVPHKTSLQTIAKFRYLKDLTEEDGHCSQLFVYNPFDGNPLNSIFFFMFVQNAFSPVGSCVCRFFGQEIQ
jgi:hypothetical protein